MAFNPLINTNEFVTGNLKTNLNDQISNLLSNTKKDPLAGKYREVLARSLEQINSRQTQKTEQPKQEKRERFVERSTELRTTNQTFYKRETPSADNRISRPEVRGKERAETEKPQAEFHSEQSKQINGSRKPQNGTEKATRSEELRSVEDETEIENVEQSVDQNRQEEEVVPATPRPSSSLQSALETASQKHQTDVEPFLLDGNSDSQIEQTPPLPLESLAFALQTEEAKNSVLVDSLESPQALNGQEVVAKPGLNPETQAGLTPQISTEKGIDSEASTTLAESSKVQQQEQSLEINLPIQKDAIATEQQQEQNETITPPAVQERLSLEGQAVTSSETQTQQLPEVAPEVTAPEEENSKAVSGERREDSRSHAVTATPEVEQNTNLIDVEKNFKVVEENHSSSSQGRGKQEEQFDSSVISASVLTTPGSQGVALTAASESIVPQKSAVQNERAVQSSAPIARADSVSPLQPTALQSASHSATVDVAGAKVVPSRIIDQVVNAMQQAVEKGQALKIRLDPPELGVLQIEVSRVDGVLTAKIETDSTATQRLIHENLALLKEALAQKGQQLDKIDVEWNQRGFEEETAKNNSGQTPTKENQQHGNSSFTQDSDSQNRNSRDANQKELETQQDENVAIQQRSPSGIMKELDIQI